jgi:hypothetical protein
MNRRAAMVVMLALPLLDTATMKSMFAQTAGFVVEVQGKCFVRRASDSSQTAQLIRSKGTAVYVEDLVRCDKGGSVTLNLQGRQETLGESHDEYAVPLVPSEAPGNEQKALAAAFKDYGKRGGRDRSAGGVLYSPPADGSALPSTLVVRWNPWPGANKIAIRIETHSHREVFHESGVDGTGKFASDFLHAALRSQQQANPDEDLLLLIYVDKSTIPRDQVQFRLISPDREISLQHDLKLADGQESPLARRIVRGYAFGSKELWSEAAAEYEAAVEETQGSSDLLQRAICAENDTGNLARQSEFERQLRRLEHADAAGRP